MLCGYQRCSGHTAQTVRTLSLGPAMINAMDPSTPRSPGDDDDLQSELDKMRGAFGQGDQQSMLEELFKSWTYDELGGPPKPLFSQENFQEVLSGQYAKISQEIRGYPGNELLNTGTERLLGYLYDKYAIYVPALDEQNMSVRHYEAKMDFYTPPGFRYVITVPFTGNPKVFNSRPENFANTLQPPLALIKSAALVFVYDQIEIDEDTLKAGHNQDLAKVKTYLGWLAADANAFNSSLHQFSSEKIQNRRTTLLKAHRAASKLGIRLERATLPATYAAPQVQRKPRVVRPKASTVPYVPEPALEMDEYEHILDVIRGTTLVIERNPSTFAAADEPLIRDHFLVQLNGHYQGQATGETFNSQGKSDILIRSDDKNIFIAEVKFWDGARSITNALSQLLTRYTLRGETPK